MTSQEAFLYYHRSSLLYQVTRLPWMDMQFIQGGNILRTYNYVATLYVLHVRGPLYTEHYDTNYMRIWTFWHQLHVYKC